MQLNNFMLDRYAKEAPQLLASVTGEEDDHHIMKRDATSDFCVKFEGGLCGIQSKLGEEFLGDACYFYPRVVRKLGTTTTFTAALSCPEITRLTLFEEGAFAQDIHQEAGRIPERLQNYLPDPLTADQAWKLHRIFLEYALTPDVTAERSLMRIFSAMESLMRIPVASWLESAPFYLDQADATLPAPEPRDTDTVYLLQALCGLVAAAKKLRNTRLMKTIAEMERALHVRIPWDTLAIATFPDSSHAMLTLHARWQQEWKTHFSVLLKRYLAAQLSQALFPFAGFGQTPSQRIAIIGIRLATVKLAIMSACTEAGGVAAEKEVIRVVQSLSRLLDHLAEPEFSLKIYQETGWLQKRRLRALLGDA